MVMLVSKYTDFVAVKDALGPPRAFFYEYLASPAQCKMAAIFNGGVAVRTNTITSSVPTPATILGDFPEAVQMDHVEFVTV